MAVILKIILLLLRRVDKLEKIGAIELNISCPNVKMGGMAFGTNLKLREGSYKRGT